MRRGIKWSWMAIGVALSSYSLVCTALRGKLGVFSEMETNFKVCGPVQALPPKVLGTLCVLPPLGNSARADVDQ